MKNKINHFNRTLDIDKMLHNDAIWLSIQTRLTTDKFLKVANQVDIRQKDWDMFWKKTRETIRREDKVECVIGEEDYWFTEDEFEVVKQVLKNPSPEQVSNCCSGEVMEHNDIYSSICRDCGSGCGVVYIF